MAVPPVLGVHLLPSTGEWAYDTIATSAAQWDFFTAQIETAKPANTYAGGPGTDYSLALDQLQAEHPETTTVSLVVSWFFDSLDAAACRIYPSTIYLLGAVTQGGAPTHWHCSGLTEQSFPGGVIPLPMTGADNAAILAAFQASIVSGTPIDLSGDLGSYIYGGTPSDPSIVRCIQDLRARGFRVVFYPFLLGTVSGYPWRGRITASSDLSTAASAAVAAFLGPATPGDFTRDPVNKTVGYARARTDWTYRRMILHYANLCVLAGGVDLFVIGSELRGLEAIRGPGWTRAGTTDGGGHAVWDYPFISGLVTLANDVRSIFDAAGLTKDMTGLHNLITYSADWSSWMGWQHDGAGQWPHLDSLYASAAIDLVSFDNYLPLTDWTTGDGGLDVAEWSQPAPTSWPPSTAAMSGLGLSGVPTIYSPSYISSGFEGGQYFNWYYVSGGAGGHAPFGLDPNGSGLMVTLPAGDRLAQARNPYYAGQEILAPKQLRWWWNHTHRAIYDTGSGWVPQGPATPWSPQSKPVIFLEYGFSNVDKGTNQPNVFYDAKSTESATAYWSAWRLYGATYIPVRDDTIAALAVQAFHDYWLAGAHNETSGAGVPMIQPAFCCAWNWDARPFPVWPLDSAAWGDAGNWPAGDWISGLRTALPPPAASADPTPPTWATFPTIATLGWSVHAKPRFSTEVAARVSGRETRRAAVVAPLYDFELTFEVLRGDPAHQEMQAVVSFFEQMGGAATPFWFTAPNLDGGPFLVRFADDVQDFEEFMSMLWKLGTLKLQGVRG